MSVNELNQTAKELLELKRMKEEIEAKIEALSDKIKMSMIDQGKEVLTGDGWKASWKNVVSQRFDSKAFKAEHGDLYTAYSKQVTTCRFLIGA